MSTITIHHFLILSALLFCLGLVGTIIRKNILIIFMSIEVMLNAVNLTFVSLSYYLHKLEAQVFVFFVMVIAAAEATIGLAIIIAVFKNRESLNVDRINLMKL